MNHPLKAILVGTIAGGFSIQQVVNDADQAAAIVIALLADGKMAEAIDVLLPSSLSKKESDFEQGSQFIVFYSGLGNPCTMYGPFPDEDDYAQEFGERHRSEGEEWELFDNPTQPVPVLSETPRQLQDSTLSSQGYADIQSRLNEALPALAGYEKGYRDALESFVLAIGSGVKASVIQEALTTTLDAYGNNVADEDLLTTLNLNIYDDAGVVVDGATAAFTVEQLSDIVDHASQAILLRRSGQNIESVMDELDEALSASDVLFPEADGFNANPDTAHHG